MGKILIIDDNKVFSKALAVIIEKMGHDITSAFTFKQGLELALSKSFDVVFLDVGLPDGSGLDLLPRLKETKFNPEVIIITGDGDPDGAELAINTGAWDYIEKSASTKKIVLPMIRAMKYREKSILHQPTVALKRDGLIGESTCMKSCLDMLAQAAESNANVLVIGETGTGKELISRTIHRNSQRFKHKFVVVDCGALPENLVESALFGHTKGAFTSADKSKAGLVKQADRGTLFLDEVGELPLSVQKKFLRVLQEHCFRPVGGEKEVKSDFRIIAATNRNLEEMVKQGQFRKDFLFRLNTLTISAPSLKKHPEDIKELVLYHMSRLCEYYRIETKGISSDFFEKLHTYNWPGNVRELVNTLENAITAARHEPTLLSIHLPTRIRAYSARVSVVGHRGDASGRMPGFRELMIKTERKYLQDLMVFTENNIKKSCRISGLSRSRMYALLKKHNISR
ncbi:sigma-54 dependent transcriptional regulator [Desulfobacterales bacterium HSG17]|nr:sigma-54 dependent transcriptional regulator [Desulfobacterales bacterium HSG17]